jgi:hypothetical protein
MTDQHPITPPPELVRQWSLESQDEHQPTVAYSMVGLLAAKAAQWGADQELEACCTAIDEVPGGWADSRHLRHVRRRKPLSLKEQALHELADVYDRDKIDDSTYNTIRRALEALDD